MEKVLCPKCQKETMVDLACPFPWVCECGGHLTETVTIASLKSHIQPEASWEKEFDEKFVSIWNEDGTFNRMMTESEKKQLKDFISQAISEEVEAERKRIEEVVKGLELDEQFVGPLFNAGHSAALGQVLSLIHPQG